MKNPASDLHHQLTIWYNAHGPTRDRSIGSVRDDRSDNFQKLIGASVLLREIWEVLDEWEEAGSDVEIHRRHFPSWAQMVYSYPHGWTGAITGNAAYPPGAMDTLKMLSLLVDASNHGFIAPAATEKILDFLAAVQESMDSDEAMTAEFRSYIGSLITAIRRALDHEDVIALRDDLWRLWCTVPAAYQRSKTPGAWQHALDWFDEEQLRNTLSNVAGGIGSGLFMSGLAALPGGGS